MHKRNHILALLALACALVLAAGCSPKRAATAADSSAALAAPASYESFEAYETAPEWNTEEYSGITENRFRSAAANPLSTFAADVDTASYANLRRMIAQGNVPEPDAVRIEEMLNYFSYDYPLPRDGEPFSVTTQIAPCPWNGDTQLLLIGLQAQKPDTETLPPANFVFLLDVSGSMDSADKLPLMKRAFLLLCEQLRPEDVVSIVTYASADRVVLAGATGDERTEIMSAIENLTAGGSTAGAEGIQTAYALAERYFIEGGNNRVILGTDGDLNVGVSSEGALKRLVEEKRRTGVHLSVMGFGTGNLKDNKLETLADNGDGNYSYIDGIAEARKVLVEEMGGTLFTLAKDVKFQIEFNPERVKGYRLIGYENRLLNDEDFNDDKKDGGEIGTGHRMTVLYELALTDSDMEIPESGLKYQQRESVGSDEYLTVNIRYQEPAGGASKLLSYPVGAEAVTARPDDNLRFAAAVAQAGMLLRASEYAGSASYAGVLEQLSEIEGLESDEYRYEFYNMVRALQRIAD